MLIELQAEGGRAFVNAEDVLAIVQPKDAQTNGTLVGMSVVCIRGLASPIVTKEAMSDLAQRVNDARQGQASPAKSLLS